MFGAAFGSAVHLLALAVGLASIHLRARRLGEPLDDAGVRRVLAADNVWGIAALLWIGSGLARLLWLEKSPDYFLRNGFFWVKMGLFGLSGALEAWPMAVFMQWRIALAKGLAPDTSRAPLFHRTSRLQVAIIVAMLFVAPLMARGAWLF